MSILQQLRALTPRRPLSSNEAQWVAERQAAMFRRATGFDQDPLLPRAVIEDQPKVTVVTDLSLPSSGTSHWTGGHWQITINGTERFTRQRFTLAHEYKHIIDHPYVDETYAGLDPELGGRRAEAVCDYFAACLLMPKVLVRSAWVSGGDNQHLEPLAAMFGVSQAAMALRLRQLGLNDATQRCRTRPAYYHTRPTEGVVTGPTVLTSVRTPAGGL